MISLDTNILSAYLNPRDVQFGVAQSNLARVANKHRLLVCGAVYSELLAAPFSSESGLDEFLEDYAIAIDWQTEESIWREAGRAFRAYSQLRQKYAQPAPRRILADFLIGAHALERGLTLLTLDSRLYTSSFPKLQLEIIS